MLSQGKLVPGRWYGHRGVPSAPNPYCVYSTADQPSLAADLFAYLDERVYPVPLNIPIRLMISGAKPEDENTVQELIRDNYNLRLQDKRDDLRLNAIKSGVLTLTGLLALGVFFVLQARWTSLPLRELLSLLSWFALWEAADSFFFERGDLRLQYLMAGQMAIAQIVFLREE